jgi:hypothetical protein
MPFICDIYLFLLTIYSIIWFNAFYLCNKKKLHFFLNLNYYKISRKFSSTLIFILLYENLCKILLFYFLTKKKKNIMYWCDKNVWISFPTLKCYNEKDKKVYSNCHYMINKVKQNFRLFCRTQISR